MSDSCASSHQCPSTPPSYHSEKYEGECIPCKCGSKPSYVESTSTEFCNPIEKSRSKLDYAQVKALLMQPSSITGQNLFNHLVEIIQRIIDERPLNVIDYFEQYSRSVREPLSAIVDPSRRPQFLELALDLIKSLNLQNLFEDDGYSEEAEELIQESVMSIYQSTDFIVAKVNHTIAPNENILQFQYYWALCGLGFQIDEIFHLSWAVQRVKFHQSIRNVRFWGRIYGLHGSYYIVEATLTRAEIANRIETMKSDLLAKMIAFITKRDLTPIEIDDRLIPGTKWQSYSKEELEKLQALAAPVPQLKIENKFEMPPEPIGSGLNRKTYFVTTSLNGEWQELPIVTPEQIQASRKIKKYFTGDLEANLACYPLFPGLEKNYLRAMIARITAGTYIAPHHFYRKMTKKEQKLLEQAFAEEVEEGEEEEVEIQVEEEQEEEEEEFNNDTLIIENSNYEPFTIEELEFSDTWVHVRPNILNQGRVVYINVELATKDLEKKALLKMNERDINEEGEEGDFDIEEEEVGGEAEQLVEEQEVEEEEQRPPPEVGPELFSFCSDDTSKENIHPWTSRYSSMFDETNQKMIMRSNIWPGAFSFSFDNVCDSIYFGWGLKYVSRCISLENIPKIEDDFGVYEALESTDPTVEMEEKWRLYHLRKEIPVLGEMSNISVEIDLDDENDEILSVT